ncbi:hypothetical protein J5690_01735 [bacterium]|nr:hypothetical protein [bacterium]
MTHNEDLVNKLRVSQGKLRIALYETKNNWKDSVGDNFFKNYTGDFEGKFSESVNSLENLFNELSAEMRELNELNGGFGGGFGGSGFDIPQNFRQHTR